MLKSTLKLSIIFLIIFCTFSVAATSKESYNPINNQDTVYTDQNAFIEVNLTTQLAIVHFKNREPYKFKVSTGTAKLDKGEDTRTGIFLVKSKAVSCLSKQFETTLLYWLGFNRGVGFHALEGSGYYRYLGKRPSSHGCIRVSRDDAKTIYKDVAVGTPVLIHFGIPKVVVAFADGSNYERPDAESLRIIFKNRAESDSELQPLQKILITKDNVTTDGLKIKSSVDPKYAELVKKNKKTLKKDSTKSVSKDSTNTNKKKTIKEVIKTQEENDNKPPTPVENTIKPEMKQDSEIRNNE